MQSDNPIQASPMAGTNILLFGAVLLAEWAPSDVAA
jgi:hypothetical protein